MTDEQRAELALQHLERAGELINKLVATGAWELEGAQEAIVDVVGLLNELEFEEGHLVAATEPVPVGVLEDDGEDHIEDFREDIDEE